MLLSPADPEYDRVPLPAAEPTPDRNSGKAPSVGNALAVLVTVRGDGVLLGVTQVAERAGIPKSTANRLLAVLVEHGYAQRDGARYRLSQMMFELGNMVAKCRPRSLRAVAAPLLSDLCQSTHATVHLSVLDQLDVLYVDKITGHRSVQVPSQIGSRLPALFTALGKAMLAFSDDAVRAAALWRGIPRLTVRTIVNPRLVQDALAAARARGVAENVKGSRFGAQCIAAPKFAHAGGAPVGALSLSFPVTSRIPSRAEELLRAATGIVNAAAS